MDERKKMYSYRLPFPIQLSERVISPQGIDPNSYRQSRLVVQRDSLQPLDNAARKSSLSFRNNSGMNTFKSSRSTSRVRQDQANIVGGQRDSV